MNLTITNIREVLFRGKVNSITAPGSEGEMTILPKHMPLVSSLKGGAIIARSNTETFNLKIERGILEVTKEEVIILL